MSARKGNTKVLRFGINGLYAGTEMGRAMANSIAVVLESHGRSRGIETSREKTMERQKRLRHGVRLFFSDEVIVLIHAIAEPR